MNKPDTEIKRWGIVVIQSLNSNEIKTGENLYNDILQYKNFNKKESFSLFYDVQSLQDFRSAIEAVENLLTEGDILTLQIESHGREEGIGLSNGELLRWKDFYDIIRPLNIKTGHLLFIVMAMCKSIAMISAIDPEKRAPYRAFICTTRVVTSDEINRGFLAFYDKYFNMLDIVDALKALQEEVKDENGYSPFQLLSAEKVFDETLSTERDIDDLCINQLNRMGFPISDKNIEEMRGHIRNAFRELYGKYSDYYNFRDLY